VDTRDDELEATINGVTERFGGPFEIRTGVSFRSIIRNTHSTIIHLTMYGETLEDVIPRIVDSTRSGSDVLIVVGATKVPREVYDTAHFNVSVGNQPHSEVSALGILLYRIRMETGETERFNGSVTVIPSARGKRVETRNGDDQ